MDLDLDTWSERVPPATERIECSGATHRITWREGQLVLEDHDVESERAFKALGGGDCECLVVHDAWVSAWDDPSTLKMLEPSGDLALETVEEQNLAFGQTFQVRYRYSSSAPPSISMEIQRSKRRLVLFRLPPALKHRLMLEMLVRVQREHPEHPEPAGIVREFLHAQVSEAMQRCVSSWTRRGEQKIIEVETWESVEPRWLAGWVGPTRGYALLGVPWTWLFDVWGSGLSTVDGCFVLSAQPLSPDQVKVLAVRWEKSLLEDDIEAPAEAALPVPARSADRLANHYSDRLVPVVQSATAFKTDEGWMLRWL